MPSPAAADLLWVIETALERGGSLLAAGEIHVARTILGLAPEPALLYARLTLRVHDTYPLSALAGPGLEDPGPAARALVDAGLADHLVTWNTRADRLTRAALVDGCRRLGLQATGSREALTARLRGHAHWHDERWLRTRHRALVRRLERWAFLRRRPDRSALVVERLGHVRWPSYTRTRGAATHRDRRSLLRWEALLDPELPTDAALVLLEGGAHVAPGRLHLGRAWRRRLAERARELERGGELAEASRLYARATALLGDGGDLAVRRALVLERLDDPGAGLEVLREARLTAAPDMQPALARTARRLARRQRTAWRPDPPRRRPTRRLVPLPRGTPSRSRPRYRIGGEDLSVERAVMATLTRHDRAAIHGEGGLWTTLFALLFADCYFLPVEGTLPVRRLSGPLDLGTPAFRRRRAPEVDSVLERVHAGEAGDLVLRAAERWAGVALAGASWNLAAPEVLARAALALGSEPLVAILTTLLDHGWRAASGLPDLLVLPGPSLVLEGGLPSRLTPEGLLVEVKGPTDTLRDAQVVWFDRLLAAGAHVELWEIRPSAPS